MSVESALATEIKQITEVAALIADRVWPVAAPQTSEKPFVTFRRVPGEVQYTHSGESSLQKAYFQISAVSDLYEIAQDLAKKLRAGLSGKRGSLGDGSVKVNGIFFKDPEDSWNQETGLFVRTQECSINYQVN